MYILSINRPFIVSSISSAIYELYNVINLWENELQSCIS